MTSNRTPEPGGARSSSVAHIPGNGYRLLRFIWNHPEVQAHRVRAIARALAWQIWQRTVRRPWPLALSPSVVLLCYPHSAPAAGVLYCRYPDWREMHLLRDVLRPGDHFIDVGANVGVYSLMASTISGVQVWAFEPSSEAAGRASENIVCNGLEARCRLMKVAVGRSSGHGHLTVGLGPMNRISGLAELRGHGRRGDQVAETEPVDIVCLDDVIPDSVQPAVALIKIDVEGNELAVLEGAMTLLARSGAIVVVEHNQPQELSAFFAERGFSLCNYQPDTRQIARSERPSAGQLNSIYVRDIDAVRLRLSTSSGGER